MREGIPGGVQLVRLAVEKPAIAVEFLRARGGGVMDLIAHFWERLSQTPPLTRPDLHLVAAIRSAAAPATNGNPLPDDPRQLVGAMLYVPKAYRADVLAPDPAVATALAGYIQQVGSGSVPAGVIDVAGKSPAAETGNGNGRCAIDFITGEAGGVSTMIGHLLPVVHKRQPARQMVNVVMQLPAAVPTFADSNVRAAKDEDLPLLNRWRRQYKEERGILFDADLDAWVETQRVFVYEVSTQVVAVAKFDLELNTLVEIGGVYTFPEFRQQGFAQKIVSDLAARVRAAGKVPTLQVDEQNTVPREMYRKAGWKELGRLARVWLTGD